MWLLVPGLLGGPRRLDAIQELLVEPAILAGAVLPVFRLLVA